jgi:hypothetical protein
MKNGQESKPKLREGEQRTPQELLGVSGKPAELEEVAEDLSVEEVQLLIDEGAELSAVNKENADREKQIKILLRRNAEFNGWKEMAGQVGQCKIKASSSTKIPAMKLLEKIRELGKQKLFGSVFKADVTAARQYLGKDDIEEIAEIEKKEYGSVSLKRL